MKVKICALPSCDNAVPVKSFKLGMFPGEYCCHDCVNDAFALKKSGQPFFKDIPKEEDQRKKVPQLSAADFGDVGVIRHFCDNPTCTNPRRNPEMEIDGKLLTVITLCWKGRFGEYCSNDCLKTEKDKNMSEIDNESPVTAGSPATKKGTATKKSAAATKKGAPASKKAAAPVATKKAAAASNGIGRSKFANDMVITVKKTDHGKSGNGATALDAMKTGLTVEKYKSALDKAGVKGYFGWALKYATENGLATVK